MARAATAGEITLLETAGQRSKVRLGIYPAPTVYTARVNQTIITTDRVNVITYDGGSGTLSDVLPGMLMLVGSSAGASDKGTVRVRSTPSATVFYVGETSEIVWADNDYLTVINDFPLLTKAAAIHGGETWVDATIEYSDQHDACAPVPVMGPLVAVLELTGASVTLTRDWSGSYCPGSTIASYAAFVSGTATIDDYTSATPTLTFTAAGWYRLMLMVTAANGAISTGVRWVYVWDADNLPHAVEVNPPRGDAEAGGWEFDVLMATGATLSDVRDGALVVLFAEDWYGDTKQSIGPIAGYENVIAAGWIARETVRWNPRAGKVKFTVAGPARILSGLDGGCFTISDVGTTPTTWAQYEDLTVDAALWHLVTWRATIAAVCDVFLPGSTVPAQMISAPPGSVWEQINSIAGKVGARALANRYGQIYIEIDQQLLATASRSTIPVVMDVGADDWREEIELERQLHNRISMIELSADAWDGTTATQVWSRAPGNQGTQHGDVQALDGYIVADQTGANALAGMLHARENNPYPFVPVSMAMNNRMMDICPRQYVTQSIQSADTVRGISWTTRKLIPRYLELVIEKGRIRTEMECEAETSGPAGVTYIPPADPTQNIPGIPGMGDLDDLPDFPLYPGGGTWFPPTTNDPPATDSSCTSDMSAPANGQGLAFDDNHIESGESAIAACHCFVRSGSATNKTFLSVLPNASIDRDAYVVTAVNSSGASILTAAYAGFDSSNGASLYVFSPASATEVWGFKIACPSDSFDYFSIVAVLQVGYVAGDSEAGVEITDLTVGNWYALESFGGPYIVDTPEGNKNVYDFEVSHGGGWTGDIGLAYNDGEYVYAFDPPSFSEYEERIGNYGRFYFQATATSISFRTHGYFAALSGGLSYYLYSVLGGENWINIDNPAIHNICSA